MCRWYCPNRGGRVGSRRPLEPSEEQPPGAFFYVFVLWRSVALSWSGLQGAFVYPSPRPSRGEGSRSLRSLEPRSFFLQGHFGSAADRSPLHCPGQGSKVRLSPHPPALPVGKGASRCAPMWPLVGVASGLFVAVRQWSVVSSFPPAGGRAPCWSVRRFPAFRPRTPCSCNPLKVSSERYNYVLSSVLKTDASTAAFAKL